MKKLLSPKQVITNSQTLQIAGGLDAHMGPLPHIEDGPDDHGPLPVHIHIHIHSHFQG